MARKKTTEEVKVNAVPTANPQPASPTQTVAEQIWSEIKGKTLEMFSLPGQPVDSLCSFVMLDPTRCFLTYKVSAVLPALETAIGPNYTCEQMERYIVVARSNRYGSR